MKALVSKQNMKVTQDYVDAKNIEKCKTLTSLYDKRIEELLDAKKNFKKDYKEIFDKECPEDTLDFSSLYSYLLTQNSTMNLAKCMLLQQCYMDEKWFTEFQLGDETSELFKRLEK